VTRELAPIIAVCAIAGILGAFELAGAVLAIFAQDHRNPFARWFIDWLEHH
jgi:hypothetical protein